MADRLESPVSRSPADDIRLAARHVREQSSPLAQGLAYLLDHYAKCIEWAQEWQQIDPDEEGLVGTLVHSLLDPATDSEETLSPVATEGGGEGMKLQMGYQVQGMILPLVPEVIPDVKSARDFGFIEPLFCRRIGLWVPIIEYTEEGEKK